MHMGALWTFVMVFQGRVHNRCGERDILTFTLINWTGELLDYMRLSCLVPICVAIFLVMSGYQHG